MNQDVFWDIMSQPGKMYGIYTKDWSSAIPAGKFEKFSNGAVIKLTDKWWFTGSDHKSPVQVYLLVKRIKKVTIEPLEWPPDAAMMQIDEKMARWEEIE